MKASNDRRGYGWVARTFHWAVAALILAALGFGLYATSLPYGTAEEAARSFQVFSTHKTIGITVLLLAGLRILWALGQPRPGHLHPDRLVETLLATLVHWALYIGMVVMPLSGWLLHASAPGAFSRILWPFGQRLPGVPEDLALSEKFTAFHVTGWLVLAVLIALHVAGALKHALIDRDATLARMAGKTENLPQPPADPHRWTGWLAAAGGVLVWAFVAGFAWLAPTSPAADSVPQTITQAAPGANGWTVTEGTLDISVLQGASTVSGSFGDWQAAIDYDPDTGQGRVEVTIQIASLTLGAVSDSAKGPEFLNAADFPQARLSAAITPPQAEGEPHLAEGELTIAGQTVPARMPFQLTIQDDQAQAQGGLTLDRRDFGVGASYSDESTVGFPVEVTFELTATRN